MTETAREVDRYASWNQVGKPPPFAETPLTSSDLAMHPVRLLRDGRTLRPQVGSHRLLPTVILWIENRMLPASSPVFLRDIPAPCMQRSNSKRDKGKEKKQIEITVRDALNGHLREHLTPGKLPHRNYWLTVSHMSLQVEPPSDGISFALSTSIWDFHRDASRFPEQHVLAAGFLGM